MRRVYLEETRGRDQMLHIDYDDHVKGLPGDLAVSGKEKKKQSKRDTKHDR